MLPANPIFNVLTFLFWFVSSGATLEMEKGHISLLPYSIVEQLVARGEVELIWGNVEFVSVAMEFESDDRFKSVKT